MTIRETPVIWIAVQGVVIGSEGYYRDGAPRYPTCSLCGKRIYTHSKVYFELNLSPGKNGYGIDIRGNGFIGDVENPKHDWEKGPGSVGVVHQKCVKGRRVSDIIF